MAQKRAARRSRTTVSSGSKGSVELGRNGEYRPSKKPSTEGASQSGHVREGSESMGEETAIRALVAMASARDGPPEGTKLSAPPKPATAEPTSSSQDGDGEMSSKSSASRRQEEMAEEPSPSEEEGEEKESEEEWTEPPGTNPRHKRKRASGRVTRSQQRHVPEPSQQRGKEVAQPSESTKRKSKKSSPAPLQQQLTESEMPKSKKSTPAASQQQDEERSLQPSESEMPKSKRIRRIWAPSDEVQILTALVDYRRKQGKLPAPENNGFFDSIAKRLEDKTCTRFIIKDKVRSLMRHYKSHVVPTTDHEQRIEDLSKSVWGDMPATHAGHGKNDDDEQDEGEHAMAQAENGGGQRQTVDKSFEEMCEMYPLLGQEVKRLAGVQPALRSSFTGLDGKMALLMEKKLDKVKWKELKIHAEMEATVEAPKARIRRDLVNFLSEVSKNV